MLIYYTYNSTGLFLSSGSNIAEAGPAGALIAYCVGKQVAY